MEWKEKVMTCELTLKCCLCLGFAEGPLMGGGVSLCRIGLSAGHQKVVGLNLWPGTLILLSGPLAGLLMFNRSRAAECWLSPTLRLLRLCLLMTYGEQDSISKEPLSPRDLWSFAILIPVLSYPGNLSFKRIWHLPGFERWGYKWWRMRHRLMWEEMLLLCHPNAPFISMISTGSQLCTVSQSQEQSADSWAGCRNTQNYSRHGGRVTSRGCPTRPLEPGSRRWLKVHLSPWGLLTPTAVYKSR